MTLSRYRHLMLAIVASLAFFTAFAATASAAPGGGAPYYVKTGPRVFQNVDAPSAIVFAPGLDDSDTPQVVPLPFSVYSGGQSYNEISVSVNGYFGYGTTLTNIGDGFSDTSNENTGGRNPVVYVHAADLATPPDLEGNDAINRSVKTEVQQLQTGKAFIIEWDVVNCCDLVSNQNAPENVPAATRMQAVLYENSDRVDVRYGPNQAGLLPGYQAHKDRVGNVVRAGSQSEDFPAESTQITYSSVSLNGPKYSNQSPSYTGVADPNGSSVRYEFYHYGESPVKSGTATVDPVTGAYSINVDETDGFGAGEYILKVEQTGADGVSINTNELTTIVDVLPPNNAPFISIGEFTVYKTHFPTYSGFADNDEQDTASVTIEVHSGNSTNGPIVDTFQPTLSDSATQGRKTFSSQSTTSLPDGTYTYRAYQTDYAGNQSLYSVSQTFRVDTVAPATPTVSTQPSGIINNPRPVVSGTVTPDPDNASNVVITYQNTANAQDVHIIPATIQSDGSFSATPAQDLVDGNYTVVVELQDIAGNTATSSPSSFTVDTTGPLAPVVGQVPLDTKDSTPTISGTATYAAGGSNNTVTVRIYGYATDSYVRTVTVPVAANGSFSTTISPALADGNYAVDVQQSDAAGNVTTSDPQNFTVDTTVPSASVSSPTDNASSADSTPTFSGSASSASGDSGQVQVLIYSGNTATGSPVQSLLGNVSNGQYSVTADELLPGQYTATVSQSDAAGNQVTRTVHFTVTIAPTDLQIALQSSTGSVTVGDNVTHTVTVANNGPKTQGVVVRYNIPSGAVVSDVVVSQGTCDIGTSVITCSLGFLPQEGQAVLYVTLKTTAVGTLSTSASVSSPASDTNSANNGSSNSVTVNAGSGGGGGGTTDTKPKPPITSPNTATPSKAISQTAVVLTGTINPGGAPTQYYFEYGTGTKYTGRTPVQTVTGSSPVNVTVPLNGLQLGTSYHFRLVAINDGGTTVGPVQTIKTIGKVGPKALTLQVKKAKVKKIKGKVAKKAPLKLLVSGKLSRPATVAAKAACAKGRVQVVFSDGKKAVYKKTVKLTSKCTYKLTVTLKSKKQLGKKGKVVARAQYRGNTVLKSKYSKKLTVKTKPVAKKK